MTQDTRWSRFEPHSGSNLDHLLAFCGRLRAMNFIEDVMERSPASRLGIVAVDAEGNRRDWHFGELIARSAGLSGAFAARGVRRGDVVMTLLGNRVEWALTLLACWRMGAVPLPCTPQLRRHDLELRAAAAAPALCVGEKDLLGELPDDVPAMTLAEVAATLDEDRPQETPAAIEPIDAEDPALVVFTSGTTGEPRGVVHAYGYRQTETGHISGNLEGEPVRPGSMGRPLPGIEVRVVDGELQLQAASSPTFFSRYLDGERFEGEWWPTGDMVREEEDGHLYFEGRGDDLIVSAGYRIGPVEVESALLAHPAVAEAAAVAAPDPERGAVVRAIVVPRDREPSDELARELQEHCKRETAPYKFPRIVEFAAELPKTASGKIRRAALRG